MKHGENRPCERRGTAGGRPLDCHLRPLRVVGSSNRNADRTYQSRCEVKIDYAAPGQPSVQRPSVSFAIDRLHRLYKKMIVTWRLVCVRWFRQHSTAHGQAVRSTGMIDTQWSPKASERKAFARYFTAIQCSRSTKWFHPDATLDNCPSLALLAGLGTKGFRSWSEALSVLVKIKGGV